MSKNVDELPAPPGMERKGELFVPKGTVAITPENKKFLAVRENLKLSDLKGAILYRYLNAIKSEKDGVSYFNGNFSAQDLAAGVMEELALHLHLRVGYEGMTPDLFKQLKAVKEKNSGRSYISIVMEEKLGLTQKGLEQALTQQGTDIKVVSGLAEQISNSYYHRELSGVLQYDLGPDPGKYVGGIKNLQAVHGVAAELTDEVLKPLGVDKLVGAYVQSLDEVLAKVSKK
ncbi:MAG: hypothetical protein AABW48_06085 [Nanoarchaeota archaeon]